MESVKSPNRFRRHPKKTFLILFILIALILDVSLTGVYHLFKYGTIHKFIHRRALREPSDVFHHTLKSNGLHPVEKWGNVTYMLSTNSLGFKDKAPRDVSLFSRNFRLLFIGDSFTEGVGLEYGETFVGLIDAALRSSHIEVLNAGVASYSPAIYFKKIEYLIEQVGLKVDHVGVFLDISDIQDESESYDIQNGRVVWIGEGMSSWRELVFEYTGLLKNLWVLGERIRGIIYPTPDMERSNREKELGINMYRSLWPLREEVYKEYGREGLKKAKKHMSQLSHLLKSHNIELTLAIYPWPDQVYYRDLDSLQVRFWQSWAEENGVFFLNLFPRFIQNDRDPVEDIEDYFIMGDVHWNPVGQQLIADEFLDFFRTNFLHILSHDQEHPPEKLTNDLLGIKNNDGE